MCVYEYYPTYSSKQICKILLLSAFKAKTAEAQKDQANFILVYSSCWSQTYYCDMNNNNISYQSWSTAKNMYNEYVNILTLKHNLNGIVKINVRNIRSDLYETYIIDQNTIQIVFMKHYKYNKTNFFVDLYTIWKVNS